MPHGSAPSVAHEAVDDHATNRRRARGAATIDRSVGLGNLVLASGLELTLGETVMQRRSLTLVATSIAMSAGSASAFEFEDGFTLAHTNHAAHRME
jgi:hypothetical protein